jgi:LacI family transcriptional regulator
MGEAKKKVRMKDIADKLNISINAVSLALNNKPGISEKTRQQVLKTAVELNYFDRHTALADINHLDNICLMIEKKNFKDTRFYSRVILGIENEAKNNNYDLLVSIIDKDEHEVPSSIELGKTSGILIVGSIDDELLERILSYGIPLALVDHASFLINTDAILTENVSGEFMATKYLIDCGHKEIGFFGDKDFTLSFNERWIGFNESMKRANIPINLDYCITDLVEDYVLKNDFKTVANIIRSMDKLPTAWVCANDSAAVILISALRELNIKVPDDISVIGFDDIDLCKITSPNLTTMRIDKKLMGAKAVKNLLWRMENMDQPNQHVKLSVNLVERESVKKVI